MMAGVLRRLGWSVKYWDSPTPVSAFQMKLLSKNYHIMLSLAATAFTNARFGQGSGPIVLDDLRCTGNETDLFDCPGTFNHNCNHGEDAGVSCATVTNSGAYISLDICMGYKYISFILGSPWSTFTYSRV